MHTSPWAPVTVHFTPGTSETGLPGTGAPRRSLPGAAYGCTWPGAVSTSDVTGIQMSRSTPLVLSHGFRLAFVSITGAMD